MITTNYLLNIDLLGFSEFVKKNSTSDVFQHYGNIISCIPNAKKSLNITSNIDTLIYSDTIAIVSTDDNPAENLVNLIKIAHLITIGQYYSSDMDSDFLPLRGTITFGEFMFHKGDIERKHFSDVVVVNNIHLLLGKPIVDSYEFEKNMDLMCIALHPSAISETDTLLLRHLLKSNSLIEYNIPLKDDKFYNGFIVNPTNQSIVDISLEKLHFEQEKILLKLEESQHEQQKTLFKSVHKKYMCTIECFKFIKQNKTF